MNHLICFGDSITDCGRFFPFTARLTGSPPKAALKQLLQTASTSLLWDIASYQTN